MKQLTLSFESGISHKHRSLLDCCAAGIYRHGLTRVAGSLDIAPSNLSTALSCGDRQFGVNRLENYIEKYNDLEPVYYLIDRFLKDKKDANREQLLGKADELMSEFKSVISRLEGGSE